MYLPKCIPSSLLHLICRVPFLAVPIAIGLFLGLSRTTGIPPCCTPESMITFCFDDGYVSTYEFAYPILKEYRFVGTAFIIPSKVGQDGYMSWSQIEELYQEGWEIGSHSYTHPHLTQLSDQMLKGEISLSKFILESRGFNVVSFASPYGDWDERTVNVIRTHYLLHRTSWPPELNSIPLSEDQRYYLKAVAVDEISLEEIKQWIDRAKAEKKWLILIFHRINENVQKYNLDLETFRKIVDYVHSLKFEGATFNELFDSSAQ